MNRRCSKSPGWGKGRWSVWAREAGAWRAREEAGRAQSGVILPHNKFPQHLMLEITVIACYLTVSGGSEVWGGKGACLWPEVPLSYSEEVALA